MYDCRILCSDHYTVLNAQALERSRVSCNLQLELQFLKIMSTPELTANQPKGVQEDEKTLLIKQYVQKISGRLRQLKSPSDNDKKRWVWELLQNAKDCIANSTERFSVDIEVLYQGDYVWFKHNGEPFSPSALNSLIYQMSEGKRGNTESTGRFGTGFLTTHTLSQNVFLESLLVDSEGVKWGVSVNLYRDGELDDELEEGIRKTLDSRNYSHNPINDWTVFKYHLKSQTNKESAKAGISSLKENIYFTLAFTDKINSIKLVTDDGVLFVRKSSERIIDKLKIIRFSVFENQVHKYVSVILADAVEPSEELTQKFRKERVLRYSVAVQVLEDSKEILPISSDTPYLHCVFPLIGTEAFHFPVVINSPDFEPNQERERLLLSGNDYDHERDEITNEGINKKILVKSLGIYSQILSYLADNEWKSLHLLAQGSKEIPLQEHNFDKDWYKKEIRAELRRLVLSMPMVETSNGFKHLNDIYFPKGEDKGQLAKIWGFTNDITPNKLPKIELIHEWEKLIWNDCHSQTVKELTKQVSEFQNLSTLPKGIDWLNNLLHFIVQVDESYLNEFALIPNIKGEFRKLNHENLSTSDGLPDAAFPILTAFAIDWADTIVDRKIDTIKIPRNKGLKEFSDEINNQIKRRAKENDTALSASIFTLIAAIPTKNDAISDDFIEKRKDIWAFSKAIFGIEQPESIEVIGLDEGLWDKCDEWIIDEMIKKVSTQSSLESLIELSPTLNSEWLNDFIYFVSPLVKKDTLTQDSHKILPNQYGIFKPSLGKDDNIPEELKDSMFIQLGIDLKDELLDIRINKFNPDKTITLAEAATRINDLLRSQSKTDIRDKVVFRLVSLLPNEQNTDQETLFSFSRTMYGNEVLAQSIKLNNSHFALWSGFVNEYLINKINIDIEQFSCNETSEISSNNLINFANYIKCKSSEERDNWNCFAVDYLNGWIDFLKSKKLSVGSIIPNQNGNFCEPDDIFSDDEIPEFLKDIIVCLNPSEDFRQFLVHEHSTFEPTHSKNTEDIAKRINELIKENYNSQKGDADFSGNFKKAIQLLIVDWLNEPNYPVSLHKKLGSSKNDKVSRELFDWTFERRYELETNVLSTVHERSYLYSLNNFMREKEIPHDVVVARLSEYEDLKVEVAKLRNEVPSLEAASLVSKFNLTEDRIKLLLEIEEKTKQFEGTSNFLEQSAQELINETGIKGEEIVFNFLTKRFGYNRVRWVSRRDKNIENVEEHRYDFEVLDKNLSDVMWYVDAKATVTSEDQSDKIPILIRKGTWNFIRENGANERNFFLARVFNIKNANAEQVQLLKIQYHN